MKQDKSARSADQSGTWALLLFVLVGALFFYMSLEGIRDARAKPSLETVNKKRASLAKWPAVMGTLDRIDIISYSYTRTREPSGTDYWPEVKYRYKVDSHAYTGDCLRKQSCDKDLNVYFCNDPLWGLKEAKQKLVEFLPSNLPEHRKKMDADHLVYSYFPNCPVKVYYDPKNPKSSMLDSHWQPLSWGDYYSEEVFMVGFCALISLLMFSIPAIHFVVFSGKKSTRSKMSIDALTLPKAIPAEEQWKIDNTLQNPQHKPQEID